MWEYSVYMRDRETRKFMNNADLQAHYYCKTIIAINKQSRGGGFGTHSRSPKILYGSQEWK
jgi:hypothetical protein